MSNEMENLPDVEPCAMSFPLLREITDGFSEERLIGRGGYGEVYKGVFGDGRAIAVRKLYPLLEIDDEQFQKECANLMKVRHQNIVRLLGYCYEQGHHLVPHSGEHIFACKTDRVLCFEYMENGSLDRHISDVSSELDWHTCYRIIKGVCEGLRYLQEELESPIYHLDLKPGNILLDQHMEPKIGGFGLQRLLGEGKVRRMGTIGYMPPEFVERQVISHKSDVYSLGVIILELITGQRSGCNDAYSDKFTELAHEKWREKLQKTVNHTSVEVKKCLEIASKCVEYDIHERPSISDIVHSLNEIETLIPEEVQVVEMIPEEVQVVQNRFDSRNSELLDVHPLELCFPFMLKGRKNDMISCSLQLKNKGGDNVAFMLVANSPERYLTKKPLCGVVPPRCARTLTLTMLRQPPSTLSDSSLDYFTLYSVAVGQYDLLNVDKDSVQYDNFFKRSMEYGDEVQVETLKVICDRRAAKSAGTSPEVTSKDDRYKMRGEKKALQLHDLPPDILGDIMALLSFKEAARISMLSNRWRHLWRSCNRNLVFTRKTMLCPTNQEEEQSDFIRNVDSVLCQLSSTTPKDKFVLKFKLHKLHARRHVDRWVAFCAASGAKHIVFDFNPGSWGGDNADWCSFPLHHFSGDPSGSPATNLHLMSACLDPRPPPDFCGFTNLQILKLDSVSGDIQCLLLPACSTLEWLSITRCTLHSLSTPQPLCRLWYLCVQYCKEMHKLEVQAPNLATFEFASYEDHPVPFVLDGCVDIQEVTVTLLTTHDLFDYAFAELPGGMAHVRKLSMELAIDTKVREFARCPSSFVNLRHLTLTMYVRIRRDSASGALRLACLLELAPVLEQLEVHMECRYGRGEEIMQLEEPLPRRPHDHLKMVHMTGVYGYSDLLSLILHFARNALVLERMVIDPMVKRSNVMTRGVEAERSIALGRRMARKHLQGRGLDSILTIL